MKNEVIKYSLYFLSVITVILFAIMGFYPTLMEIPTLISFGLTILIYFAYSIVIKRENKSGFICDSIIFITFNIIGFGFDRYYISLFPFTITILLINLIFCLILIGAYVICTYKTWSKENKETKTA